MKCSVVFILIFAGFGTALTSCESSKQRSNTPRITMQSEVTGAGRPLVLVPGGLTGWVSWEPFVKYFAESRTTIRVQLIGVQFGLENRPLPDDYSVKTESTALAATLDSLGFNAPLDLVAWSFGAFTALDYALDHPARIRTLTLIEPPAMWVLRATGKWDDEAQELADLFKTQTGDITEEMLAEFIERARLVPPGKSPRELPMWNNWLQFRRSLRINPSVVSFHDDRERLRSFQAPTLLVKGIGSANFLHRIINGLSENIPNSRVIELPGGHAPHLVSREKFLIELAAFHNASTN